MATASDDISWSGFCSASPATSSVFFFFAACESGKRL